MARERSGLTNPPIISKPMDLVTFGEAMVRFSPPAFQRLEQARSMDVHVGGSDLNVAVGAARLGLATRWVSRLTENPLGRMVAERAREHGVDVSHVVWTGDDRVGLYFAESAATPRSTSVVYDRTASAMSRAAPGTIDWVRAFDGARWFHTSGITPALSDQAAATTAEALAAARVAGLTVSYDVNYRAKLWSAEKARATQEPLMPYVDVLITSTDAACKVFGIGANGDEHATPDAAVSAGVARALHERFGVRVIAVTLREGRLGQQNARSAVVYADGETYQASTRTMGIVDEIGAGDAFTAGLIFGRLRSDDWQTAVEYGTAVSALKYSIRGDFSLSTLDEVDHLLGAAAVRLQR